MEFLFITFGKGVAHATARMDEPGGERIVHFSPHPSDCGIHEVGIALEGKIPKLAPRCFVWVTDPYRAGGFRGEARPA
jgi:hypothetical protein